MKEEKNTLANKIIIFILILLVIASAFTGLLYFNNRSTPNGHNSKTSKNSQTGQAIDSTQNSEIYINLVKSGEEEVLDLSGLNLQAVSGSVINGKGIKKEINSQGINLKQLSNPTENSSSTDKTSKNENFKEAKIISDDGYNATVKSEEFENAWLTVEDSKTNLIVFGDENSKRNVKNVIRIELN